MVKQCPRDSEFLEGDGPCGLGTLCSLKKPGLTILSSCARPASGAGPLVGLQSQMWLLEKQWELHSVSPSAEQMRVGPEAIPDVGASPGEGATGSSSEACEPRGGAAAWR